MQTDEHFLSSHVDPEIFARGKQVPEETQGGRRKKKLRMGMEAGWVGDLGRGHI
jgi:hypothetical protein